MPHRFATRSPRPGLPPGETGYEREPTARPSQIRGTRYDASGADELRPLAPDEVASFARQPGIAWIDVVGIEDSEVISVVCEELGVHPLTVEDILELNTRIKAEEFSSYLYLSLLMVQKAGDDGVALEHEHLSIVIGHGWVLTFQEREGDVFAPVQRRVEKGRGNIRRRGADYLGYALLDAVVDNYRLLSDEVGREVETLDRAVVEDTREDQLAEIHELRRALLLLRKGARPLRDVVAGFSRCRDDLITDPTRTFLRDVSDHVEQVLDATDLYWDLTKSLADLHEARVGNRMNAAMMLLSVYSAIFLPITFFTGLWGMNFVNMPELRQPWGYPMAWVVIGTLLIVQVVFFYRRGWLRVA